MVIIMIMVQHAKRRWHEWRCTCDDGEVPTMSRRLDFMQYWKMLTCACMAPWIQLSVGCARAKGGAHGMRSQQRIFTGTACG
jgi:hypothetical protein